MAELKWVTYVSEAYVKGKAYDKSKGGFTVKQACMSGKAKSLDYANKPNEGQLTRLKETLKHVNNIVAIFEDTYKEYGVWIESGYRSPCVNKAVGGAQYSGHKVGGAVDLKVYRKSDCKTSYTYDASNPLELLLETAAKYIIANNVKYNEFLREIPDGGYWFHLSIKGHQNKQSGKTYTLGSGQKKYMNNYYGLKYKK